MLQDLSYDTCTTSATYVARLSVALLGLLLTSVPEPNPNKKLGLVPKPNPTLTLSQHLEQSKRHNMS